MSLEAVISFIVVPLLSIGVAVYFGHESRKLARANAELQKRLLAIEEDREKQCKKMAAKAQLQAGIVASGRNSYKLFIENKGSGEARNVVIKMDGVPFEQHKAALEGDEPISVIGPHSQIKKLLALSMDCSPPFQLEVSWEDDSGKREPFRTTLTL